ncbi:MAG TPA: tyrosine-type recombinase/integrase [Verrucomicrobiae bacterium]|nr:tyrosine-type recombinase/integrase [Verrucomicrobiae bacterium]
MSTKPSKRVMGQGTVYQRPGGLWAAQVAVEGRRRTVYARSQQECVAKLHQLQQQVAGGLPAVDQRGTVGRYLDSWLESVAPRLRPSTAARYGQIVKYQLNPQLGRVKLAKLQPADVGRMLAQLQQQGLSPRTAAHCRAVLRCALGDGERWGVIHRNAARLADPPRVPHQQPKVLTPAEAHAVVDALNGTGLERAALVALYTGLRQGELLGLTWDDFDPRSRQIHVRHALQRVSGSYLLVEPKSASSRRAVPVAETVIDALEEERRMQRLAQLAAGSKWRAPIRGLIFTTTTGQPRNGSALTHVFVGALTRARLPALHWHHLRHAYAGLMLGSGSDLATVSHLLGHSSVALTASTYAGILPSLRQDAAERFERLLHQPG